MLFDMRQRGGREFSGLIRHSRYAIPRAVSPPIKVDKNSKLIVDPRNATGRVKQYREKIVSC